MRLGFLDLATRKIGWCSGVGSERPDAGAWLYPQGRHADLGSLGVRLHDSLDRFVETRRPELIGYESPIKRPIDNLDKIRKLYGLGFYVETYCRRRGIECVEVDVSTVKRDLAGFAQADKSEMVVAALKAGIILPAEGAEDAADAFGGWLTLVRVFDKANSLRWDRVLWGARGTLL